MNKLKILLTILLCTILLTACEEEIPLLTEADYELNQETGTTSRGIGIGSTPEDFLEAYGSYDIETSKEYGPYESIRAKDIPFTESIRTILPTFFIDGLPATIEQICTDNGIARSELLSLLSSEEYLQNHRVVYHYMIFTWEDGFITDIHSELMDYNEDASYYEDLEAAP